MSLIDKYYYIGNKLKLNFFVSYTVTYTVDDDFRGRLLKKKLAQSRQLSTWLSDIASHLQLFWLQTFFCDLSHIHTRVSFQPSAHCNLTWLCCFILRWALFWRDTLFWLFGTSRIVQIPSFYSNTSGNDD